MFNHKRFFVPAAFIVTGLLGVSAASAQDPACPYNLASLQGPYSVVITYGANIAQGLQTETLDGKGNVTRTGIINQPTAGSTTGARTIVPVTTAGTYKVNCDGTGTFTLTVTRADGTSASASHDFMITGAIKQEGRVIATTISDLQRDPSVIIPGGIFVSRVHTRLPEVLSCPGCIRTF
jgi:hypothetical protein